MSLNNFIKIGCSITLDNSGKKSITGLPKDWLKSSISIYNNEPNFMILCGKINNITVIDLDAPKNSEVSSIDWFESKFGKISELDTLVTKTINNGYHIYFTYTEHLKTTTKFNDIPLDILNDQKGVLEGQGYTIINDCNIRSLTDKELSFFQIEKTSDNLSLNLHNIKYSKDFLIRILDGLSKERFDNHDSWLRLGFFLHQFHFGKELFDYYSKKSDKFNQSENDSRWNSFNNPCDNPVTIGTLMFWLKDDNPNLFSIINKESKIISEINEITKHENITANEVIKIDKKSIDLMCEYEKAIVPLHDTLHKKCSNCSLQGYITVDGFVLKCKNCSFSYPQSPIPVEKTISPTIYNIINQVNVYEDIKNKDTLPVCNYLLKYWNNSIYYDEKIKLWLFYNMNNGLYSFKSDNFIIKFIDDTVFNIKSLGCDSEIFFDWISKIEYKKSLLSEIKTKCLLSDEIIIDNNPDLLGFPNGILDLNTFEFHKGKKDEFITMKCKYEYNINTDIDIAYKFLSDTFIDKKERMFLLNKLSSCLSGENKNLKHKNQNMNFCYGPSACNGKSFLMDRLHSLLGNYADTFPVNMITNKMKNAGDANTTLLKFKNKRFMYCSEPESNCKLNTNFVKQLTGDTITARALYSNNEEKFLPTFQIFMCCNVLPELDSEDAGFARRVAILEFKTKFVDNPKNKYEKQLKNYSKKELEELEKSLLHLLINNYKILKEINFTYDESPVSKKLKNMYTTEKTDEIKEYLDEFIKYTEEEGSFIKASEIKMYLKSKNIKVQNAAHLEYLLTSFYPGVKYIRDYQFQKINYSGVFINIKLL